MDDDQPVADHEHAHDQPQDERPEDERPEGERPKGGRPQDGRLTEPSPPAAWQAPPLPPLPPLVPGGVASFTRRRRVQLGALAFGLGCVATGAVGLVEPLGGELDVNWLWATAAFALGGSGLVAVAQRVFERA